MSVTIIAEELYEKGIQLKKCVGSGTALYLVRRRALLRQVDELRQLAKTLRQELSEDSFSGKYFEAAEYMLSALDECRELAMRHDRKSRRTVCRRLYGFHNLPRAFLSAHHPARISPDEATSYSA